MSVCTPNACFLSGKEVILYKFFSIMEVKFIKSFVREAAALPQVLDSVGVPFESINPVNWPDEYPYRPEVKFRLGYSPNGLLVHYQVTEDSVRARYGQDNGHV